jgi:hypothetical protein
MSPHPRRRAKQSGEQAPGPAGQSDQVIPDVAGSIPGLPNPGSEPAPVHKRSRLETGFGLRIPRPQQASLHCVRVPNSQRVGKVADFPRDKSLDPKPHVGAQGGIRLLPSGSV